jgi:hypothetical protein
MVSAVAGVPVLACIFADAFACDAPAASAVAGLLLRLLAFFRTYLLL